MKRLFLILPFLLTFVFALNSFKTKEIKKDEDGKTLYLRYCSLCHMLPDPASLTKRIWQYRVLPVMASRMGIVYPNFDPLKGLSDKEKGIVKKNKIIPEDPIITQEEWEKVKNYIVSNSPDTIFYDTARLSRNSLLKQFVREEIQINTRLPSLITGLKFNAETNTLWIGDYYKNVYKWQFGKGIIDSIYVNSAPVDFNFYKGDTYVTEIGKLYPTELNLGSYAIIDNGIEKNLLDSLHRPVNAQIVDLDNDGVPEIVMCNFGNKIGSLSVFKKDKRTQKYVEHVLLSMPGAVKCYVEDMDGDGKKDIVALFAQGDESVYIFYQKDNFKFKAKKVLRFPPNYGTTDMVLVDYNHDGLMDIVTVHGDNADYSNILKPYHGIRLNINQGNGAFKEKFFYPIYGVTKVVAEDFDKDGDIDFAASSFFPDFGGLVNESFVYLENIDQDKYKFKSYILKSDIPVKSLTIEKADVDGDGDMDIILGNFAQSPGPVPQKLDQLWKSAPYGLVIFYNQLHKPKK